MGADQSRIVGSEVEGSTYILANPLEQTGQMYGFCRVSGKRVSADDASVGRLDE